MATEDPIGAGPIVLGTTAAEILAVQSTGTIRRIIRGIIVTNVDSSSHWVTIGKHTSAADDGSAAAKGRRVYDKVMVHAGVPLPLPDSFLVETGGSGKLLYAFSDTADVLNVLLFGVDFTP